MPDASLVFEFSANSGSLTAFVTTDSYGMANTNVTKVLDAAKPAIIRAYPLFKSRGYSYAFSGVSRDRLELRPGDAARSDAGDLGQWARFSADDVVRFRRCMAP